MVAAARLQMMCSNLADLPRKPSIGTFSRVSTGKKKKFLDSLKILHIVKFNHKKVTEQSFFVLPKAWLHQAMIILFIVTKKK